jgi:hypothetical protein
VQLTRRGKYCALMAVSVITVRYHYWFLRKLYLFFILVGKVKKCNYPSFIFIQYAKDGGILGIIGK